MIRPCDWRLQQGREGESQCSELATYEVKDRHGVLWGYCDLHYPLRYYQAPFRMQ